MGTGTLACVTLAQGRVLDILAYPARILNWLNLILFVTLSPFALFSWLARRQELCNRLNIPGQMGFFATIGIALLVLANQSLQFGLGHLVAWGFWVSGVSVIFFLNIGLLFRTFLGKWELADITPSFFMPVVALIVIPVAGCPLAEALERDLKEIIIMVCAIGLGAGLLLYIGLFCSLLQRHLLLPPLEDYLAPTLWIHLAPLGWGAISLLVLAGQAASPQARELLQYFALLAWGASAWWVIMDLLLTVRAMLHKGLYFSMAWWSFIFPLGSFTVLTGRLEFSFASRVSLCVWFLMAILWIYCGIKTLRLLWKSYKGRSF